MNTVIVAGGSGFRVLEAQLHLCAAGLGPGELRILAIDPDGANGNYDRTKRLLASYLACQKVVQGKLGSGLRWFGTKLDLLATDQNVELKVWTPVQTKQTLRQIVNYDVLPTTATPPGIVNLFFTDRELNVELDQGFRGHPAIGAATMSLVSLQKDRQPWSQLLEKVKGEAEQQHGARVFLAASVFGGTGAATIHPISRFLKDTIGKDKRLHIAVAALVPYFRFSPTAGKAAPEIEKELYAKSEQFPMATRAAVEFYDYLRKHEDWPFDSVHWIGDSGLMEVPFAIGSSKQQNPAHFVDLLGALAGLEHFQQPNEATRACYYSGPRSDVRPPDPHDNLIDWEDVPLRVLKRNEIRDQMLAFFMSGAAHLAFYGPLLARPDLDRKAHCLPWYQERFRKANNSLMGETHQKDLETVSSYFRDFHFPWWAQVLGSPTSDARLFNRAALRANHSGYEVDLARIANYLSPDRPGEASLDHFDRYFTSVVNVPASKGGSEGVGAYLSLLGHGAESFVAGERQRSNAAGA